MLLGVFSLFQAFLPKPYLESISNNTIFEETETELTTDIYFMHSKFQRDIWSNRLDFNIMSLMPFLDLYLSKTTAVTY